MLKSILNDLKTDKNLSSKCILVKLNGLIHTNDRLALKSITSQMQLDYAIDGKVFGSFAENLAFLLACLKTGDKQKAKSVIFILEEFDLFCGHHNQTLLYNLFDVSQSAQTPLCVFGVTCRLDVIELFEKRVKSRFSHRQIFLFAGVDRADVTELDLRLEKIREVLSVENESKSDLPSSFAKEWNKHVKKLVGDKNFAQIMERLMYIDNKPQTLKNILFAVVSKLDDDNPLITLEVFKEELERFECDELVQSILDLSVLELCLLLSMKHHVEIYNGQPMNFEMITTRFMKFTNANANLQTVPRAVVMKAFEHLEVCKSFMQ